jgi:hypothetical protein
VDWEERSGSDDTMSLRISKDLALPLEAVTQTIAALAKRRAGKSYTIAKLVEELVRCKQQVVIIDPKGDWWGIRSSANGKEPGLPVVILGGSHGDVPLETNSGELVGRMVVEERISVLLDLSEFRKAQVPTFMAPFLETVYRLKAKDEYRTAMMMVIDEADAIAPQRPFKGEERMLGAAEDIVRRGGQRGIGCTMATQRAAVLNKNVLTQSQMLIALRLIAPQDRDALEAWIEVHGTEEQRHTLMESLGSLPTGTAWFWSPGWPDEQGIFKRVQVAPRTTFDSFRTPAPGEKRVEPKTLADVDLDALKKRMAATIERAKAEDPRELRRRIKELEATLAQANAIAQRIDQKLDRVKIKEKRVETPVLKDAQIKRIETALERVEKCRGAVMHNLQALDAVRASLSQAASEVMRSINAVKDSQVPQKIIQTPLPANIMAELKDRTPSKRRPAPQSEEAGAIKGPEQRILDAIGWLESLGIDAPEQTAVAFLARYKYGGGAFNNPKGRLRQMGHVEYLAGNLIRLTETGKSLARIPEAALTTQELHARVMARLKGPEQRILQPLLDAYPNGYTNEELSTLADYSDGGGAYNNPRGRLRSMGLIEYRAGGKVFARDILFLERLP